MKIKRRKIMLGSIVFLVAILALIALLVFTLVVQPGKKQASGAPAAAVSTPAGPVVISDQQQLSDFLARHDDLSDTSITVRSSEHLAFPQGKTFTVKNGNSVWNFSVDQAHSASLNFNGSKIEIGNKANFLMRVDGVATPSESSIIENGSFYGSASSGDNGRFNLSALQAQDFQFQNLNYYAAQGMGNHLFDLAGCRNIDFSHIQVNGFGSDNADRQQIDTAYQSDPHSLYAEAIQLDYPYQGAFGTGNMGKDTFAFFANKATILPENVSPQMVSTTNVSLSDSTFAPYVGQSGQAMIDASKEIVHQNYSPTALGSHNGSGGATVTIKNNKFDQTVYTSLTATDKRMYPLHFKDVAESQINLYGNTFTNQHGNSVSSGWAHANDYVAWISQ